MDFGFFINRLTNTINKNRPAEPEPVVFVSADDEESKVVPNRSPRWQRSTKRIVIIGLAVIGLICLFLLRNMISPMIFSCLLIFYLRPLVLTLKKKWNISYKGAVLIVFGAFLIVVLGLVTISGFSVYGQMVNFFDLINRSVDNLPNMVMNFLGGEDSTFGKYFSQWLDSSQNSELNQQIQSLVGQLGGSVLTFVQNFSSQIGWFFFIYGFSFFIVWGSEKTGRKIDAIPVPGYEYDIEMGGYHLSMIWKKFLSGQANLMLITLIVYTILFMILRVRYAFILACAAALTRLVPYVGSFIAWTAVALVSLFQGSSIFGMAPFPYAVLTVGLAFLIDKFMDGFVQPKFLAETLKVHPAAVLFSALICARVMGFLGIFLAAPLVATLELILRYIIRKLRDLDPWEGLEMVDEPLPLNEYLSKYRVKFAEIYDKLKYHIINLRSRIIGGKNGSNGL